MSIKRNTHAGCVGVGSLGVSTLCVVRALSAEEVNSAVELLLGVFDGVGELRFAHFGVAVNRQRLGDSPEVPNRGSRVGHDLTGLEDGERVGVGNDLASHLNAGAHLGFHRGERLHGFAVAIQVQVNGHHPSGVPDVNRDLFGVETSGGLKPEDYALHSVNCVGLADGLLQHRERRHGRRVVNAPVELVEQCSNVCLQDGSFPVWCVLTVHISTLHNNIFLSSLWAQY